METWFCGRHVRNRYSLLLTDPGTNNTLSCITILHEARSIASHRVTIHKALFILWLTYWCGFFSALYYIVCYLLGFWFLVRTGNQDLIGFFKARCAVEVALKSLTNFLRELENGGSVIVVKLLLTVLTEWIQKKKTKQKWNTPKEFL